MMLLLFAAHQGEEFVLILPAMMLLGAFFIMRWANQPTEGEEKSEEAAEEEEEKELVTRDAA
jgi:hypothetical protein